jgi:hypothetical protein
MANKTLLGKLPAKWTKCDKKPKWQAKTGKAKVIEIEEVMENVELPIDVLAPLFGLIMKWLHNWHNKCTLLTVCW